MNDYSDLRRQYHKTGSSDYLRLADLLPALREFESTNPRDKLYALIPTSIDGGDLLDVDYSSSIEDVYINAACSILKHDGNLNFLAHCTDRPERPTLELPTWVPDWTAKNAPDHLYKRTRSGLLYSASGKLSGGFQIDRDQRTLHCEGAVFDVVEQVSELSGDSFHGPEVIKTWTAWLSSVGFATPTSASRYTLTAEEILLRTLVADSERTGVDFGERIGTGKLDKGRITEAVVQEGYRSFRGPHPAFLHRKLILTRKGYLGLAAKHVQRGDVVTILKGGNVPIILREKKDRYHLIGEAYIHGIMDGEAVGDVEAKGLHSFSII